MLLSVAVRAETAPERLTAVLLGAARTAVPNAPPPPVNGSGNNAGVQPLGGKDLGCQGSPASSGRVGGASPGRPERSRCFWVGF